MIIVRCWLQHIFNCAFEFSIREKSNGISPSYFNFDFIGNCLKLAQWSICTVRQLHIGHLHSGQLHSNLWLSAFVLDFLISFLIIKWFFLNKNNFPCSISNFSRCWKSCSRETKTRRDIGFRKSKNNRVNQAVFWGKKFEDANYSSFERAFWVESADTKIILIGWFWTKLWPIGEWALRLFGVFRD